MLSIWRFTVSVINQVVLCGWGKWMKSVKEITHLMVIVWEDSKFVVVRVLDTITYHTHLRTTKYVQLMKRWWWCFRTFPGMGC